MRTSGMNTPTGGGCAIPRLDHGWIRRNDVANSLNSFNDGILEKRGHL